MRIIEKKILTREVEDTKDILCNKCGESLYIKFGEGIGNYEGLIEAYVCGGFSALLGDEVGYNFSLCEKCLSELFKTFKYSALIENKDEN